MSKYNSELWDFSQSCRIGFIFILHTFCVELVPFDKATFSGQDEVSKSNLIASVVWLSVFKSHAPTTQPSRQLKVHQLLITQHIKLIIKTIKLLIYSLSIYIVNYHHSSPEHQLSLFEVIPSRAWSWAGNGYFEGSSWGWLLMGAKLVWSIGSTTRRGRLDEGKRMWELGVLCYPPFPPVGKTRHWFKEHL